MPAVVAFPLAIHGAPDLVGELMPVLATVLDEFE